MPVGNTIPHGAGRGRVSGNAPSLFRSFTYDDEGNQIASLPSVKEWTQACEDAAQGTGPAPEDPIDIPFGVQVVSSSCFKVEDNITAGPETSIGTYTVPLEQIDYLRYVHVSSCNRGVYKLYIDNVHIMTRRTTWTRFNETFDLSTANGGKKLLAEQVVDIRVINIGSVAEDFEGVFVVVQKPV